MIVLATGGFAYAGGWFSPGLLTQERFIDTFQQVFGLHPGFRRNHAKGVCIAGSFESNGQGVRLSKAEVFAPGRVPVLGRFAIAGGQPYAADSAVSVRSMALRFTQPDGEEWRTGINSIPVFSVNTPQAFYDQLAAAKPDPATGKPDPAALKAFFDSHPRNREGGRHHQEDADVLRLRQHDLPQPRYLPLRGRGRHVPAGALGDDAGAAVRVRGPGAIGAGRQELPVRRRHRPHRARPAAMAPCDHARATRRPHQRRHAALARRPRAGRCGHAHDRPISKARQLAAAATSISIRWCCRPGSSRPTILC
ncbi:MAG: catalase [Acetobacteraceae bacterium]